MGPLSRSAFAAVAASGAISVAVNYDPLRGTHNATLDSIHAVTFHRRMTRDDTHAARTPVTFRGRGLGLRLGSRLVVLVCPLCSQRNAPRAAERGVCEWCAYVPALEDAEQAEDA